MSGIPFFTEARSKGLSLIGHELWLKPWRSPSRTRTLPAATADAVAACAVHGLTFWSLHPTRNHLWAADFNGVFHTVRVDGDTSSCNGRSARWSSATTMSAVMTMLGGEEVPTPDNPNRDWGEPLANDLTASAAKGPLGHCASGHHTRCPHSSGGPFHRKGMKLVDGTRYYCTCECHQDGFVLPQPPGGKKKSRSKAKTVPKAPTSAPAPSAQDTVVSMINATPSLISGIHADLLISALGRTDHDDQITAELHNRGITATPEAS